MTRWRRWSTGLIASVAVHLTLGALALGWAVHRGVVAPPPPTPRATPAPLALFHVGVQGRAAAGPPGATTPSAPAAPGRIAPAHNPAHAADDVERPEARPAAPPVSLGGAPGPTASQAASPDEGVLPPAGPSDGSGPAGGAPDGTGAAEGPGATAGGGAGSSGSAPPGNPTAPTLSAADLAAIHGRLAEGAARCYPPAARRFRLEGTTALHFCVDPQGQGQEPRVEASSGHALLDQAAITCVFAAAQPFPPMTAGGCFTVPVRFGPGR